MSEKNRVFVRIEGRVQGVGFRYFTQEKAQQFSLKGWVRNTHNGAVESVAEGNHADLEHWINFLRIGPGSALVTELTYEWSDAKDEYKGFQIAPTL